MPFVVSCSCAVSVMRFLDGSAERQRLRRSRLPPFGCTRSFEASKGSTHHSTAVPAPKRRSEVRNGRWAVFRSNERRALVCQRNRPRSGRLRCASSRFCTVSAAERYSSGACDENAQRTSSSCCRQNRSSTVFPTLPPVSRFEDLIVRPVQLILADRSDGPAAGSRRHPESWAAARLDPATAIVRVLGPTGTVPADNIRGWLFTRVKPTGPAQANESRPRDECAVRMSRMRDGLLSTSDR